MSTSEPNTRTVAQTSVVMACIKMAVLYEQDGYSIPLQTMASFT
jgi:hypothetical protein